MTDRNCWYLDSSFCSGFHTFKANVGGAENGRVIITLICWGITISAFLLLVLVRCGVIRLCFRTARKQLDVDRDGDGVLTLYERWLYFLEEV